MPSKAVLLADAHADTRRMLCILLRRNGYEAREAGTEAELFAELRIGRNHVLLLEPWIAGEMMDALVGRLEQVPNRPPTVLVSGCFADVLAGVVERLGPTAVLQKPAMPEAILAALAEAVGVPPAVDALFAEAAAVASRNRELRDRLAELLSGARESMDRIIATRNSLAGAMLDALRIQVTREEAERKSALSEAAVVIPFRKPRLASGS